MTPRSRWRLEHAIDWISTPAPRGMRRIERRIDAARTPRLRASLRHEVLLAMRLAAAGFSVRSEVATPSGRSCDLVAIRGSLALHFHVKCMSAEVVATPRTAVRIPAALRALEQIRRRLLIEIEWTPGMSSNALRTTADAMRAFLIRAAIGDECVIKSTRGTLRGRCHVRSPSDSKGLVLTNDVVEDSQLAVNRVRRLLRRAREQFLPGGENIIVVFGPRSARWIFLHALPGTPIERWDRFPRRGERVAFGHGGDGFWGAIRARGATDRGESSSVLNDSRIAVWGSLDSTEDDSTALIRGGVSSPIRAACAELFTKTIQVRG